MKNIYCFLILFFCFLTNQKAYSDSSLFHIGLVTGSTIQGEDSAWVVDNLIKVYGNATTGGIIKHVTYPDNFMLEMEESINKITALSDDPLVKAIIVIQAIPGTADAFRRIKEKRKDILLIAGESHEDPQIISSYADLSVNTDYIARGYLLINLAKEMGAKTFVHISFPRHMSYENLAKRRTVMEIASKDLGIKFIYETSPDPISDVGISDSKKFIFDKTPIWIQKYGKETAFFCTNDAQTEPLLKQLLKHGGIFVEADQPSPFAGYPAALMINPLPEKSDFSSITKKIEVEIKKIGATGKFGTWQYPFGYTVTNSLVEYVKRIIEKKSKLDNIKELLESINKNSPGSHWNGRLSSYSKTDLKYKNYLLLYQDTYIFGKGNIESTKMIIPEKYFKIN